MKRVVDVSRSWTRGELLSALTEALDGAGVEDARRNAEWMMAEVLCTGRAMLYAWPEREVPEGEVTRLYAMARRRAAREPLQYVLGSAVFHGLQLRVTPDVLIPRPETEFVAEEALGLLKPYDAPRVLDAGTGSGAIALAVASARPDAEVWACDVSEAALDVARENASAHRLDVRFLHADVLSEGWWQALPHRMDMIVSNPPYIPASEAESLQPEVRDHEPHLALFCDTDPLLFYRALAAAGHEALEPGGMLVLETHADFADEIAALLHAQAYQAVSVLPDLAGLPRCVTARRS